jgi:purine-cytosine permease-like protein
MASSPPKQHGVLDTLESQETPGGAAELQAEIAHDYSSSDNGIVPLSVRRGTWTHHVPLWLTLYAGFAYMSLGSELYTFGYSLGQVILIALAAGLCYLLYAIPAAYLGARTGQTHALMSRSVFGKSGSLVVSALVLLTPLGWVGYQANILADIWNGLLGWGPVIPIAVAIAVLGITNNILGFTGIAAFARWIASPLILIWVAWVVFRTFTSTSPEVLASTMPGTSPLPIVTGIVAAIGFATYGNEPDLFRYAKPSMGSVVPPLFLGLLVGLVLFPIAGWIIAARIESGDFAAVVAEAVSFSLGGLGLLAVILATPTEIAINDANYYESLNAGQNLLGGWSRWRRIYSCILIAIGGGFMAWWVPQETSNFFRAATFLAVTVPTATVVMYTDQLVLPRLLGIRRSLDRVPSWNEAAFANWPAIVALVVGVAFGSYGSGILPGQDGAPLEGWGIVPVEAWILAGLTYIGLVAIANRSAARERLLGFPAEAA